MCGLLLIKGHNMKKRFLIVCIMVLCAMAAFCGGDKEKSEVKETVINTNTTTPATTVTEVKTIIGAAADVELVEKKTITKEQVLAKVDAYKAAGVKVDEKTVLDEMINSELLNQSMKKDNVDLDTLFNNYVLSRATEYASQYDVKFETVDDVKNFFIGLGTTLDDFAEYVTGDFETELVLWYVETKLPEVFNNIPEVSVDDINLFYSNNKDQFVSSEKVKIAHIFFPVDDEHTDAQAKSKADSVYQQIQDGSISFEKAVLLYSDDKDSNEANGVLGWMNYKESGFEENIGISTSGLHRQLFTEKTFNKIFELSEGQVSSVLKSEAGYHIVKVIKHNGERILSLTDAVFPEQNLTVSDFCKSYLMQAISVSAYQNAYNQLLSNLRAEAKVKTY